MISVHDLGVIRALWQRDLLRLAKERTRWIGVVAQPLLFWFVIGSGMATIFTMPGLGGMSYLEFFYPGILVMIVLFTTIFATISVVEDRQSGFLQTVVVSPGSRASMVLGKIAGVTSITLIQTALFLALAPVAGYAYGDIAWVRLILVVILGCAGLTGVGFTIAWALNSTQGYHAIMSVVLLPLWVVSGAMFPVGKIAWLRVVMTVNPMSYIVSGVRLAMAPDKDVPGPGFALSLIALLIFALAATAIAVRVSRKSSARP
ncbi:MAG: ABC transporter permease [Alphaproteobacteria bacterium]|uniref:Transport permease protein n=1 Tax=Candidatus Nitrobium versatile TaxID=2884831 RepID=A0A953J7X7_9BACT|nr:ABC transporter permease [Candidatus Nitrobium versatile]